MTSNLNESGNPAEQARAARDAVVLRDESDHGLYVVTGKDRVDLLQRISSNDLKRLAPGIWHWNCFTTNKGKIVDRVLVLASEDSLLLRTSPGRGGEVVRWIDTYTILEKVQVAGVSAGLRQFHLLGPKAGDVVRAVAGAKFADLAPHAFSDHCITGTDVTIVRTDGLLEHPGFLFLVAADAASEFATRLLDAGKTHGVLSIDETAFEATRAYFGVPAYGREITDEHHPLEAGLWGSVSFTKGCYVGQEVIARLRTYDKVTKHLCRLRLSGEAPAGATLFSDDKEVGKITTAAGPPLLPEWRALGYVKKRAAGSDAMVLVGAPDAAVTARVLDVIRLGDSA